MIDRLCQKNVDISLYSNFGTPARTKYYYEIQSSTQYEDVAGILKYCHQNVIPCIFVSGGTNMLFAFDCFDGVIVRNTVSGYTLNETILDVEAGQSISGLAQELEQHYGSNIWHRFI